MMVMIDRPTREILRHRMCMMSPTEYASIGTRKECCGFHASVRLNPIEGVFVTPAKTC